MASFYTENETAAVDQLPIYGTTQKNRANKFVALMFEFILPELLAYINSLKSVSSKSSESPFHCT